MDAHTLYTQKEIQDMNRTARYGNKIGVPSKVMDYVKATSSTSEKILDFGAGKKALHTLLLRKSGFKVTAYEIGDNATMLHDPEALSREYDTVYASKVVNVQPSSMAIHRVIRTLALVTKSSGRVVFNYPKPIKSGVSLFALVVEILPRYFSACGEVLDGIYELRNPII